MRRAVSARVVFWLKAGLWLAAVVLPGGLLLLPVIYALHRREARLTVATPDATAER